MSNPYIPLPVQPEVRLPGRVYLGTAAVVTMLLMLIVPALVAERMSIQFMLMMGAPVVGLLGVFGWWVGFSRMPVADRLLVPALFLVPLGVFVAESVLGGQPPMAPAVYGVPFVLLVWVGWAFLSYPLGNTTRRAGTFFAVLLGWLAFGAVRVEQTDAELLPNLVWRWTPKPEYAFAAIKGERGTSDAKVDEVVVGAGDWAEFRGPNRDSRISGVKLDAEKFGSPKEVWKKRIGPGWGSFAVAGGKLFTLEQQGDNEAVVCLDADTGKLVWEHTYPAKFTETIAGAGPRSTPTVKDGKVYAQGATGVLHCLDAASGKVVWTTELARDAAGVLPMWGFASSPLVTRGRVIVYTGGLAGKGTTAFDTKTGQVLWQAGNAKHGYSSAQTVTFAGVEQVLMVSDYGLESFDPTTGKVLWEHNWPAGGNANRTCQPVILGDGELLLGTGVGATLATRRLKVTKGEATGWSVETVWESKKMSPYFNDGVVHNGHYYGFSGGVFHCIELKNGAEKWSAGKKYGNGQVLLFADQGLLVVTEAKSTLTAAGRVFLLEATPDDHTELTSFPSVVGKTWNHPSFAHGRLYVRNGVEAACYALPTK